MKIDQELDDIERRFIGQGSELGKKRILAEYKTFMKSKDFSHFKIEFFNGDNFYKWIVKIEILKFDPEPDLKQDFITMRGENPTLDFEMTFPENFPFDPPFIRVTQPKFMF